ncbi:MAG: polysaccharide export protein [Sedimentisphaerales bacterium]|nr:polysaccharide export protein [Sedimentisphaerales bacterium]
MRKIVKTTLTVVGLASLIAIMGCGSKYSNLEAFLQVPHRPVSGLEYRVYPPDVLSFSSVSILEINKLSQRIRPDGKIVLPLLGEIDVAGKTPAEVEAAILQASEKYYGEADVTVEVAGYNSQKFFVLGQVSGPGPVPWTGSDTVLDALARSRPTDLAWPEKIKLIRAKTPQQGGYLLPKDKDERKNLAEENVFAGHNPAGADEVVINLKRMVQTGDMSHNVLLQPGDVIFVPPNPFAAVGLSLRQVLFPVQPVVEAASAPYRVREAYDPGWAYEDRYRN